MSILAYIMLWSQLAGGLNVPVEIKCPGTSVIIKSKVVPPVKLMRVGSSINWYKLLPSKKL